MRLSLKRFAASLRRQRIDRNKSTVPRLLFVSHEASRTGAPKIILNLLRHFHQNFDVQCETILHNGGHLAGEFAEYSKVHCLDLPRQASDNLQRRMAKLLHRQLSGRPMIALCNSMESRFIAQELHRFQLPIVFLIHELPSSYNVEDFQAVYRVSQRIIFPVSTVRDSILEKAPLPSDRCVVLPQGLLDDQFATGVDRETARQQVCNELGLPDDAFIVLGCGTLDLRKGIDHFTNIVRNYWPTGRWIGRRTSFGWATDLAGPTRRTITSNWTSNGPGSAVGSNSSANANTSIRILRPQIHSCFPRALIRFPASSTRRWPPNCRSWLSIKPAALLKPFAMEPVSSFRSPTCELPPTQSKRSLNNHCWPNESGAKHFAASTCITASPTMQIEF